MVRDILIGMMFGFVAFLAALIFGATAWFALVLYSLAGSIGVIAMSLIRLAICMRTTSAGKSVNKQKSDTAATPFPSGRPSNSADPKTR